MAIRRSSGRAVNRKVIRPFHVLALDPGGTTGWALAHYDAVSENPTLEHFFFQSGEIGPEKHHVALEDLLLVRMMKQLDVSDAPLVVVCESFEFRQGSRVGLSLVSKEYIGVVELFSQKYDIKVIYETASSAGVGRPNSLYSDSNLKKLGWHKPAHQHANDATRHLVRHLTKRLGIQEPITDKWL